MCLEKCMRSIKFGEYILNEDKRRLVFLLFVKFKTTSSIDLDTNIEQGNENNLPLYDEFTSRIVCV